jgi:hypothetical protein
MISCARVFPVFAPALAVAAVAGLCGCANADPGARPADMRGRVAAIIPAPQRFAAQHILAFVKVVASEGRYTRVALTITDTCAIVTTRPNGATPVPPKAPAAPTMLNDIRVGDSVEILFAGPALETTPVQATAREVRIIGAR